MNRRIFCLISIVYLSPAFSQPPLSDAEYRKLRDAQVSETVPVENLVIRRDAGVITLKRGTVSFGPMVQGRVTGAVFVGEGAFALTPAVSFERDHLKMAMGANSVAENFERAIFFFTDDAYTELKGTSHNQALPPAAADTWHDMRQHLREGGESNLDAGILADLYNPKQPGFFTAYMRGKKYNDLRFFFRPRGVFQDLGPEEVGLSYDDVSKPEAGIWYLAHTSAEYSNGVARSIEEKRVVDVESYRIESEIAKNEHLTAKAGLTFRSLTNGDRVIDFELLPSLRVKAVRAEGHAITFIQEDRKADGTFHVVMPEPMVKDRIYQLEIEYAGDQVIHNAGGGNFSVRARASWYPNNPFPDQAKFDLTYKVPHQYTLVSVGTPMKESREGDFNVSHWVSDVPLAVAGFNYGAFKKKEAKIEKLSYVLEGYAVNDLPDSLKPAAEAIGGMTPSRLIDRTLAETNVAVQIYDQYFGHAPYGRIAITQQPEFAFGQSWPGLVYLPISAFLDATQRYQLLGGIDKSLTDFIQEVTPHEVSHQWWGHMVSWASYRDQWLSEGFADFSAGLFLQLTEQKPDKYLKYLDAARDEILEKNNYGLSANDVGPIHMGLRLGTAHAAGAYQRLIYPKGGYVLHMIRSMMWDPKSGDGNFVAMMHDFVATHLYKTASTESFQAVLEKHMTPNMDLAGNGKMDWFFNQWVYGTEVPRYKFDYQLIPEADGKVRLKASLTQSEVSEGFLAPVPVYLELEGGRIARVGTIIMKGNSTNSDIEAVLPQKPKRVTINQNYDVLARK
jgi:hypothetical protein